MLQKEKKQTKRNRISATALILLSVALLLTILCACGNTDRAEGSLSSADNGEPDPPSASDQLVAHAAGAVYGYRRTNSEEALNTAYWNGFLYFELDFERTSDGKTVLIHDWDSMAGRMFGRAGQLTLEEFRTSDTFMDLTVMDLDDLLKWLDRHPDCFIITDIRPDNLSVLEEISESSGGQKKQFIPQAYSFEEYRSIEELGYDRIILTLYSMTDLGGVTAFAREERPWAVTIPEEKLEEDLVEELSGLGIRTFAHTINTLDTWEYWHGFGLYGIYTDYFLPNHWSV